MDWPLVLELYAGAGLAMVWLITVKGRRAVWQQVAECGIRWGWGATVAVYLAAGMTFLAWPLLVASWLRGYLAKR